ncbi:MAG TPA: hypothetical protein VGY55_15065 [Pirellulales bacterium]|nr:hypothetical protein [Pirellulales bacterium]
MLDYQRIVDDVRSSMFSNSMEGVDFLRSAAADYSVACDEVNERLRRCGSLLRQGLRSEAIQLAEIEPNLLDLVATLDFPERSQWEQVVAHYGIVPPPPLMFDVAADLNEAYAVEQPLTELLRHHRLLALARGPLKNRINTLRSLIQADSDNQIWREDLQTFEAERLKQLQHEVADAAQAGDLMTLASLHDELRADGWSSLPPASLVRWTAGARQKLEERDFRANIERIAGGLREAHAALDADLGRQSRDQWNACVNGSTFEQDDPFVEMATSALAWLAEQDEWLAREAEHRAAVVSLASGLSGKIAPEELRRLHAAAVANGFQLPEETEARYRDRLNQLIHAAKRRRIAIISGICLGILGLAALVFFGIQRYQLGQEIDHQRDALGALLDNSDLPAAERLLGRLKENSPAVAANTEIAELDRRLETAIQKETDRHKSFDGYMQAAKARGPDHPDYEALQQATTLAKTNAEKLVLDDFKQEISAAERAAAEKRNATFLTDLDPFRPRLKGLKELSAQPNSDPKALLAEIDRFRNDLNALEHRSGDLGNGAQGQAQIILTELETIEAAVKLRREEEKQLAAVTGAIGDPEAYKAELTHYLQQFPDSPRAADFKRAIDEEPLWVGIAKWNALLTAFRQTDITQLKPDGAKELLAKAREVFAKFDEYPAADAVRLRMAYLEGIMRRVDSEQQRIEEPLKRLFGDSLIKDLWMIQMGDGRRFYLKDNPHLKDSGMAPINYITGFDLVEKKAGVDSAKVTFNGSAPQVGVAKSIRPMIDALNDANWEQTFFHIVKAIDENKEIDPILKVNLLRQTLEIGSRGSAVFERAFAKHSDALKDANVNPFANWLDPKDPDSPNQRVRAEQVLKDFPDIGAAGRETADELNKLHQPPGKIRVWVGWLRRGAAGNWRCEPTSLRDQSGELFVAVKKGIGNGITFERMGTVKDDIATMEIPAGSGCIEGSPLFLVAP